MQLGGAQSVVLAGRIRFVNLCAATLAPARRRPASAEPAEHRSGLLNTDGFVAAATFASGAAGHQVGDAGMQRGEATVEGGEPAPVAPGELGEVGNGHLAVADDA